MSDELIQKNEGLAIDCRATKSSCCYKGMVFLPNEEYEKIFKYIEANSKEDMQEFVNRCKKYDGFYLYDQQGKCQFLDDIGCGSCRLHDKGVKPTECFWWPLHVYKTKASNLEIRVGSCCSGCTYVEDIQVKKVVSDLEWIGYDRIMKFREVYSCGEKYRVIKKL